MLTSPHRAAGVAVRPAAGGERSMWDTFVLGRTGTLLQGWGWGELKVEYGWSADRLLAVGDGGEVCGAISVLTRRSRGGVAFAYAPRGPAVVDPAESPEVVAALVAAARTLARRRRSLALKLDPEWRRDDPRVRALLRRVGGRDNAYDVQHRRTYLVDLRGGAAAVLAGVKASTRHHIRRAERDGVEVTLRHDPAAVDVFYPLFEATAERKQFIRREAGYYRSMVRQLSAGCPVAVLIAAVAGEAVAGMIAVAAGPKLIFLFGGSTLAHSSRYPAYLMHWRAIEWGIAQGCTVYDMWGVPNHEDPAVPGAGYFEFKLRWNGEVARHIHMQDVPLWPALGPLPGVVERLALRGRPFAA